MSLDVPLLYLVSGDLFSLFASDGFLKRISRFLHLMDFSLSASDGFLERPLSPDLFPHSIGKSSDHAHSISPENSILNDDYLVISYHIDTL